MQQRIDEPAVVLGGGMVRHPVAIHAPASVRHRYERLRRPPGGLLGNPARPGVALTTALLLGAALIVPVAAVLGAILLALLVRGMRRRTAAPLHVSTTRQRKISRRGVLS